MTWISPTSFNNTLPGNPLSSFICTHIRPPKTAVIFLPKNKLIRFKFLIKLVFHRSLKKGKYYCDTNIQYYTNRILEKVIYAQITSKSGIYQSNQFICWMMKRQLYWVFIQELKYTNRMMNITKKYQNRKFGDLKTWLLRVDTVGNTVLQWVVRWDSI